MKITSAIILAVGWMCVSGVAKDFNTLISSEKSRIHALTDDAFWTQCPEKTNEYLSLTSPEDADYRTKWMEIRKQIMAREYPDPADTNTVSQESLDNKLSPTGRPILNNVSSQSSAPDADASPQGQIDSNENGVIKGSGKMPEKGGKKIIHFPFNWDTSNIKSMLVKAELEYDDVEVADPSDKPSVWIAVVNTGASVFKNHGTGLGGASNPGEFAVEVHGDPAMNGINRRALNYHFRITFEPATMANKAKAEIARRLIPNPTSSSGNMEVLDSFIDAANLAQAHPSGSASSAVPSSGAGYIKVPVAPRMNSGGDYVISGPNGTRVWAGSGKPYTGP